MAAASWTQLHPRTSREPLGIALGLAAVAGPVLLLGIVYNILLRDTPTGVALGDSAGIALLDSYAVEVLHVVLPIHFLLDLLLAPRRRGLPSWSLAVFVGYPSAFAYIGAMMVGFLAIGAVIIAIGGYRERRAAVRGGAASARGPLHV